MASPFNNSFFSIAGQKERIANVGATLNAAFNPFSSTKVVANVSNKAAKAVLETAANHPYATAGLATGGVAAVKAVAANPAAAAATARNVATSLIPTTTKGKIAAVIATPVIIGAVAERPVESAKALAKAPGELAKFGGDVANLAAEPSYQNLKELVVESPVITSALAGVAAVTGGKAILGAIQTQRTIDAIENISVLPTTGSPSQLPPAQGTTPNKISQPEPITTPTNVVTPTGRVTTSSGRRKSTRTAKNPSFSQRVTVNLQNRSVKIDKYLNQRRLAY